MSTNRKNRDKPVLRNMVESRKIPRRSILTYETKLDNVALKDVVDTINDVLQQINCLVADRNVPYIRIEESRDVFNLDKTRVLLRSETSDVRMLSQIRDEFQSSEGSTFLVELYINDNGYIEIGCADDANLETAGLSNFVLVDREFLSCALIDIFLDSAMFNSYSFLRDGLSSGDKRAFNQVKISFLKKTYRDFTKLDAPFYTFNSKTYRYLSMAFFMRETENNIDLARFIELWGKFIQKTYPNSIHIEPSVEEQLNSLVDRKQYSNDIITECKQLSKGSYWLLRIHRVPVNEHIEKWLIAIFGRVDIGTEKIIKFEEFDSVYELVREQHITAFKIIVQ